jgi:hypothetical protein
MFMWKGSKRKIKFEMKIQWLDVWWLTLGWERNVLNCN